MADRSFLKENLKYLRYVIYTVILCYIWYQYEFKTSVPSYSNGQPKIVGSHVNGKDEGTWTWFYANGKKQMQGDFLHGKRIGLWVIWDTAGTKISESNYENDKLNGNFIKWYSNGNIESKGVYKNDKIISVTYFNSDGSLKSNIRNSE